MFVVRFEAFGREWSLNERFDTLACGLLATVQRASPGRYGLRMVTRLSFVGCASGGGDKATASVRRFFFRADDLRMSDRYGRDFVRLTG